MYRELLKPKHCLHNILGLI